MATFSLFVLVIIFFIRTKVLAIETYSNAWAVKVLGSQQEVKDLAQQYGFMYDRYVSSPIVLSFYVAPILVSLFSS